MNCGWLGWVWVGRWIWFGYMGLVGWCVEVNCETSNDEGERSRARWRHNRIRPVVLVVVVVIGLIWLLLCYTSLAQTYILRLEDWYTVDRPTGDTT